MSLLIWLPLIDNTENQGLANINMINHNVTSNTAGKLGNCYQFNGSTAYINENSYDWTKFNVHQFTLCCWYKEPSPVASGNSQIIHIGTSSGWNNIRIGLLRRTSNGYPLFSISDGTNNINYNFAATSFSLDVWHHIAVTYDNGKLTMYLDGQVNKTMTTTIVPVITASHHLGIGGAADGKEKLTGFLNDVRIYDTALSPREIKEIAKGLVLHYPLSGPAPEQLFGEVIEDNAIYSIRQSPNKHGAYDSIVGASVVWNQLSKINSMAWPSSGYRGITITKVDDATLHVSGTATANAQARAYYNATSLIARQGHVFYAKSGDSRVQIYIGNGSSNSELITRPNTISENTVFFYIRNGSDFGTNGIDIKPQIIDLTTALPSAIVDYIMTITPMADRVAWLKRYFMLDKDYPYCEPTFKHVEGLVEHRMVGFNQWDGQWEVGEIYSKTGENRTNSTRSRSKNFIPVIPDTVYYHYGTPMAIDLYDQSKKFIMQIGGFYEDREFTTPSSCYYIKFFVNTNTMPSNICINISDSSKNGTYEPYISHPYSYTNSPTLRGVYRIDENNNLYADGDVWDSNGSVGRRYGIVSGSEMTLHNTSSAGYKTYRTNILNSAPPKSNGNVFSNFTTDVVSSFTSSSVAKEVIQKLSSGTEIYIAIAPDRDINDLELIYELATHTTETSTTFTNPQIIEPCGTELYSFTGLIPPGHTTKYVDVGFDGGVHTYEETLTNMGVNDGVVYDVSGYRYNGIYNGDFSYSQDTAKYNVSTIFNGSNTYVESMSLPIETKTVSFWIKPNNRSDQVVFADNNTKLCFGIESNDHINTYTTSTRGTTFSASAWIVNEWSHVVLIITGDTTRKLYINGIEQAAVSTNYWTHGGGVLNIGCRTYSGTVSKFFTGLLSDFRAYATQLTEDDIMELYQVGASLANNGVLMAHEFIE